MRCEECGSPVWRAGEIVPAGTYMRIDRAPYQRIVLQAAGPLPATFDGHSALYRTAGITCSCMKRTSAQPISQAAQGATVRAGHHAR